MTISYKLLGNDPIHNEPNTHILKKETIDGNDVQSIVYGSKTSPSKNGTTKKKSTKKTVAKK